MQYQLVVTKGPDVGRTFDLRPGQRLSIGRGSASDTQINDPRMSRVHCEVVWNGPEVILRDLGSSSGTMLDGKTVESQALATGQKIQCGESEIELRVGTGSVEAATMVQAVESKTQNADELSKLVGKKLGRFQLDKIHAVAKSGTVFRATDTEKDKSVAIKVLTPNFTSSDEQRERFVRAMKTMLPIRHPNIVRLLHAGKNGPYCWAAMEYVDGESLDQVIERVGVDGMLDWRDVWHVANHVASALQAAHAEQIIHRNVTPTNILRRADDKVCLLGDLMLAKALDGTLAQQVTQPGQLLGELPYQSPERTQVDGAVDARSDLYELGATLYALLTGRPPAEGKSLVEIIKNIRATEPKRPIDCQMSINENFSDLVMRLLAKDPGERYQSATELLSDLERVGRYGGMSV